MIYAEVKSAITTVDKQLIAVENKLEELNLSSDDKTRLDLRTAKLRHCDHLSK
jgi:hypothetical protein